MERPRVDLIKVRREHECAACGETIPKGNMAFQRIAAGETSFTGKRFHAGESKSEFYDIIRNNDLEEIKNKICHGDAAKSACKAKDIRGWTKKLNKKEKNHLKENSITTTDELVRQMNYIIRLHEEWEAKSLGSAPCRDCIQIARKLGVA